IVPEERVGSMEEVRRRLEAIARGATAGVERLPFYGMFEVLESLGVGAKAEVFRAYDRDPRRYVALKVLREEVRERAEEVRRLGVEARVLAAVRDEALPRLYTARLEGRPFLVMSVAEGRPAIEFCLAGHTLRVDEVIAVGRQVGGALATLHARGILHRDVNASNVIVARGAETRATLIDLGMAELTATFWAQAEDRYLTPPEERVALGTGGLEKLEWTAPEARAGKGWSGKSDVFSLGIVLFRLLTGKRPFVEQGGVARPVREVMPGCPAELAAVIGWALEVDPGRRCDARELVAALADVAEELAASLSTRRESSGSSTRSSVSPSSRPGLAQGTWAPSAGEGAEAVMEAARVERRERWRWRTIYAVGTFGFVYLGFLIGLMVRVDQAEDERAAVRAKTQAAEARTSASVVADDAAGRDSVAAAVGLVGIEAEDTSGPSGAVDGAEVEERFVGQEGQKASDVAGEVEAAAADPKVPTTATGGPLSRAQVRQVLGPKMPALRECVGGSSAVRVKVAIGADGRIRRATIAEDVPTLTRACVEGVLEGVRFPAAGGASTHTIDLGRR
ncbi:MAG TPA: protein kinase, partial [Nannocystaceae bacterium]|nr:protein kinase [Nannocystaceae bacterium]